jgi:hypothetical protein
MNFVSKSEVTFPVEGEVDSIIDIDEQLCKYVQHVKFIRNDIYFILVGDIETALDAVNAAKNIIEVSKTDHEYTTDELEYSSTSITDQIC